MSTMTLEELRDQCIELIGRVAVDGSCSSVAVAAVSAMFAQLLRERESAKAAVTDGMVEYASRVYTDASPLAVEAMRSALEAVAPMLANVQQPIPMILHCPSCHTQHIDAPETTMQRYHAADIGEPLMIWDNPPHRSHLCHKCGTIWRPADVPTVGVEKIHTEGKNDVVMSPPMLASARVPDAMVLVPRTDVEKLLKLTTFNTSSLAATFSEWAEKMLAAAPKPETEE